MRRAPAGLLPGVLARAKMPRYSIFKPLSGVAMSRLESMQEGVSVLWNHRSLIGGRGCTTPWVDGVEICG